MGPAEAGHYRRNVSGPPEGGRHVRHMGISRRAVLKGLVATGVGAIAGTGSYGFLYARHQLVVVRETLRVVNLPLALAGLRIGLLTDLHRSRFVSHNALARAVTSLMGERPDLIVLGGD